MLMGRPRTRRKDLPPGLHVDKWGTFFYRSTKGGIRAYQPIGKVDREAAIRAWVKITTPKDDEAPAGTVGELIDRFLRDLEGIAPATRVNYEFHCGKLRGRWGDKQYAKTADQAGRGDALRPLDIATYLRDARKAVKGADSAVYAIGVLSMVFAHANECGLAYFNPCAGVRRRPRGTPQKSAASRRLPTVEQMDAAELKAGPRLRLMIALARRTGMRQTDIRELRESQIVGDVLVVVQSKTGMAQDFKITPELRTILDAAEKLPQRLRSRFLNKGDGFVFPGRDGMGYGIAAFGSAWRQLKAGFQFRSIRKWAINQRIAAGGNGTDFAGHFDPKTTRQHYDVTPKKVIPL